MSAGRSKDRVTRAGAFALGLVAVLALLLPLLVALASADPACVEGAGIGAVSSAALGAHRWFSGEGSVRLDLVAPTVAPVDGGSLALAPVPASPVPALEVAPAAPPAAAESRRF